MSYSGISQQVVSLFTSLSMQTTPATKQHYKSLQENNYEPNSSWRFPFSRTDRFNGFSNNQMAHQTTKENISNLIKEKNLSPNNWCQYLGEAAYKKNITIHKAIGKIPYQIVFGCLPRKEITSVLQVNEFSQDTDTPNTEQAVDQQMQTGREQNIEETEFNDSTAAEPADIVSESQPELNHTANK